MYGVLTGSVSVCRIALVPVEQVLIVLAIVVAGPVLMGFPDNPGGVFQDWLVPSMLVAAVLQVSLHYADLCDFRTMSDRRGLLIGQLRSLGAASVIFVVLHYWVSPLGLGRGVFTLALLIVGLVAGRRVLFESLPLRREPTDRLLIAGTGVATVSLARALFQRLSELVEELVGLVDSDAAKVGTASGSGESAADIVGIVKDIPAIVRARRVDCVVVSPADASGHAQHEAPVGHRIRAGRPRAGRGGVLTWAAS